MQRNFIQSISLEIERDEMDSYNLIIITKKLTFAPQNINRKNNRNEGHAHIYINEKYFHLIENYGESYV